MFDYIHPANAAVIGGLEDLEVVYAKDQPEYLPLRTLVSAGRERRVVSRWSLTETQRAAVASGADVLLELSTFGWPLQPIRMAVADGQVDPDWVRVCLLDMPAENRAVISAESAEKN